MLGYSFFNMVGHRGLVEGLRNGRTIRAKLNEKDRRQKKWPNVENWLFVSIGRKKVS